MKKFITLFLLSVYSIVSSAQMLEPSFAAYSAKTFSDVRAYTELGAFDGAFCVIGCRATDGDGLGGIFVFKRMSYAVDDDLNVLKQTAMDTASGRWHRLSTSFITGFSQTVVSRAIGSSFQPYTADGCFVNYSVNSSVTSVLGTASAQLYLEISSDNSTWQNPATYNNSVGGILSLVNGQGSGLFAYVPKAWYVRIRFNGTSGVPTGTYLTGQETKIVR